MRVFIPKMKEYSALIDGNMYYSNFFSNREASNVRTDIDAAIPEYDGNSKNYGVKVKIDALKLVFISGKDDNTDHPLKSTSWWSEGYNEYKSLDQIASSEGIYPDGQDAIEEFSTATLSHIAGMNVKGASKVTVYEIKADGTNGKEISSKFLEKVGDYEGCGTCCPTDTYNLDRYLLPVTLEQMGCALAISKVRVVLTKSASATRITIGTQVGVYGYKLGCLISGVRYGFRIPTVTEKLSPLGKIKQVIPNVERFINGSIFLTDAQVEEAFAVLGKEAWHLNFYLVDKEDGKVDDRGKTIGYSDMHHSLMLGRISAVESTATQINNTTMPINIVSIEK